MHLFECQKYHFIIVFLFFLNVYRYHYYGLAIKESSIYFRSVYSKQGLTRYRTLLCTHTQWIFNPWKLAFPLCMHALETMLQFTKGALVCYSCKHARIYH